LQEVFLQNVENVVPFHFVDVFDGNDVLLNVGHDVFVQKDPLDGALTQDLLDGPPFFGVVSHVIVLDIVLTQTSFGFYLFCCTGLKLSDEDL
jgi:hypothetical protein